MRSASASPRHRDISRRWAAVDFSAANRAASARSTSSIMVNSRSSSSPNSATRTDLGPVRSTRRSCSSRRNASRTGVALMLSDSASPRSVTFSPRSREPVTMASRMAAYA
ncbi:hypothetical protein OHA68_39800 [Nonomuraea glycinis]|nr:hypothetical protein OHA68_39800 [Nonomuraea glycinis]